MKHITTIIGAFILLAVLGVGLQPVQAQVPYRYGYLAITRDASTNALQTGQWVTIPDNTTLGNPTGRHETSFVMAGGRFYLIAGREAADIDIYDPDTNTWTKGASIP
ncbi:MAG: kelch repeat-containing protein, partial [Chloroflexota bacterium]